MGIGCSVRCTQCCHWWKSQPISANRQFNVSIMKSSAQKQSINDTLLAQMLCIFLRCQCVHTNELCTILQVNKLFGSYIRLNWDISWCEPIDRLTISLLGFSNIVHLGFSFCPYSRVSSLPMSHWWQIQHEITFKTFAFASGHTKCSWISNCYFGN